MENNLIKYGLQKTDVEVVVTDNETKIKKGAEDTVLSWLACQPHTLHLTIQDVQPECNLYLTQTKCTAIIGFLTRSEVAAVNFSKLKDEAQKKQLDTPDVIKKNSMLCWTTRIWSEDAAEFPSRCFQESGIWWTFSFWSWNKLKCLQDKYPAVFMIFPAVPTAMKGISNAPNIGNQELATLQETIATKLKTRFEPSSGKFFTLWRVIFWKLTPRFKMSPIQSGLEKGPLWSQVREIIETELKAYETIEEEPRLI